jgi:hypothetical protein
MARTVAELEDGVCPWSSLGSPRPERRLPAPSQGSSLLGSVRIFGRITHYSDQTLGRVADDTPEGLALP